MPDYIKEERIKFDDYTKIFYIVYSSSLGNFIVGLNTEPYVNEDGIYNKDQIVGLSYMKEVE